MSNEENNPFQPSNLPVERAKDEPPQKIKKVRYKFYLTEPGKKPMVEFTGTEHTILQLIENIQADHREHGGLWHNVSKWYQGGISPFKPTKSTYFSIASVVNAFEDESKKWILTRCVDKHFLKKAKDFFAEHSAKEPEEPRPWCYIPLNNIHHENFYSGDAVSSGGEKFGAVDFSLPEQYHDTIKQLKQELAPYIKGMSEEDGQIYVEFRDIAGEYWDPKHIRVKYSGDQAQERFDGTKAYFDSLLDGNYPRRISNDPTPAAQLIVPFMHLHEARLAAEAQEIPTYQPMNVLSDKGWDEKFKGKHTEMEKLRKLRKYFGEDAKDIKLKIDENDGSKIDKVLLNYNYASESATEKMKKLTQKVYSITKTMEIPPPMLDADAAAKAAGELTKRFPRL